MKTIAIAVAISSLSLTSTVMAADLYTMPDVSVSGLASLTTDYLFRGVSQTSNNAAVQAGMTFTHSSGAYLSTWGSSIASGAGGLELDLLLGYGTKLALTPSLNATLDVGVMRYNYPGLNAGNAGSQPDYNELYGSLKFDEAVMKGDAAKVGFAYSPDYFLESNAFWNVYGEYSAPIGSTPFGFVSHVGYNKFDDVASMNKSLGTVGTDDSYVDYKVGATFGLQGLGGDLSYIGSNISDSDCAGNLCSGRVVFSLTKTF